MTTGVRTGGQLVVEALVAHGVRAVYLVPGESFLPILDALRDCGDIQAVVCRHESAAANAADAYGKLTGTPGVCLVTRGPGATQASVGLHTAMQDSTPMIMLIGQVPTGHRDREAFQELDYERFLDPVTKWVGEVSDADRLPEYLGRAFHTSQVGRPGPVALSLPEDVLAAESEVEPTARHALPRVSPSPSDMAQLQDRLERAERPLALLGGTGWSREAVANIDGFARAFALPVAATFRRQDLMDHEHPCYIGDAGLGVNPRLRDRIEQADLLLAIGPRLGDATTGGYTAPDPATSSGRLVHIHPGAEELGSVYPTQLPIQSDLSAFAAAAAELAPTRPPGWIEWRDAARRDYEDWSTPGEPNGALDLAHVMVRLRTRLPDAIVTNGAGNYTVWAHRFLRFRQFPSQVAPTSGAMGYGLPAAIAAAGLGLDRPVVALAGDGCFAMAASELSTLRQNELQVVVIVVNNGMYATIRMHQERSFPHRPVATDLINPDFVTLARAHGLHGETVEQLDEFLPALERALAAPTASLIELRTNPRVLTPTATLDSD